MNSKIILAKNINLDREYNNVIDYSEEKVIELLTGINHLVAQASDYSFIPKQINVIDTGFTYQQCLSSNYIAFQNPMYSNKWFFAFIDSIEYQSDKNTRIYFTIDYFTTWWDYWNQKACLVIREHVNDDSIGAHTLEEPVALGDFVTTATKRLDSLTQTAIVVGSTRNLDDLDYKYVGMAQYNGLHSGIFYFAYDSVTELNDVLEDMAQKGYADDIITMFKAPKVFTDNRTGSGKHQISNSTAPYQEILSLNDISSLNGYIPRNKKLLTYPYCYYLATNLQGSNTIYKQELFTDAKNIYIHGVLSPSSSIVAIPFAYSGNNYTNENELESVTIGKFPQISWNTNWYVNWLSQQGLNQKIEFASATFGAALGASSGEASSVGNYALNLSHMYAEQRQATFVPPSVQGNINSADIMQARGRNTLFVMTQTIKAEYAKMIDDFFSRYGYKVNTIKIPNQQGRAYWQYIQIAPSESCGYCNNKNNMSVPSEAMKVINDAYRRGITIWHNHENIGNYSLNNNIV